MGSQEFSIGTDNATRIGRALQKALVNSVLGNERIAREFGLRVSDLQALHLMVLRPDISTPTELSTSTGLPTSTITRILDRLEQAGYLDRVHHPKDRRRINIALNSERVQQVQARYAEFSHALQRVNDDFTDSELGVVARYLERTSEMF